MKERLRPLTEGLAYDVLGGTLYSLGYYTFATNGGFATGGVSGLALMINYFTHLPMGALTVAMNLPIVLLTFRSLGKKFLLRSQRPSTMIAKIGTVAFRQNIRLSIGFSLHGCFLVAEEVLQFL